MGGGSFCSRACVERAWVLGGRCQVAGRGVMVVLVLGRRVCVLLGLDEAEGRTCRLEWIVNVTLGEGNGSYHTDPTQIKLLFVLLPRQLVCM